MTGSASSVIGTSDFAEDGVYNDAGKWTKCKFDHRPNEQAKFLAEKSAWNELIVYLTDSPTKMVSILPYFIIGPPLYQEAFNSSCKAIKSILTSEQYGFPEINMPCIDVRDLANLHVLMMLHPSFGSHRRYLVGRESLWFSEIIDILKDNYDKIG